MIYGTKNGAGDAFYVPRDGIAPVGNVGCAVRTANAPTTRIASDLMGRAGTRLDRGAGDLRDEKRCGSRTLRVT